MVDLHCHSTASDGTVRPELLPAAADAIGLTAVALTDHDTTSGLDSFLNACRTARVQGIPGLEIACNCLDWAVHIVGLYIEPGHAPLEQMLLKIRSSRETRNRQIVEKLKRHGFDLDYDRIAALEDDNEVLGRPHLAKALVTAGYCADMKDAFSRYLGSGRSCFVKRYRPPAQEAIQMIHICGGVAVWAHPLGYREASAAQVERMAAKLKKDGLDAMEYYYSEYSPEQAAIVRSVGEKLGLMESGGSDFHGDNIPAIHLGTGYGQLHVPDAVLRPLAACAAAFRRPNISPAGQE